MTFAIEPYLDRVGGAAQRVRTTTYARLTTDLKRFFAALESDGSAAQTIRELEAGVDLEAWLDGLGDVFSDDPIDWPGGEADDIGIRLALMRSFAKNPDLATDFGNRFTTANDFDRLVAAVVDVVFDPLLDDLPRYLVQALQRLELDDSAPQGGDSRVVEVDSADRAWVRALTALDDILVALRESSDVRSDDRRQATAEVSAGVILIRSGRLRPHALGIVLKPALARLSDRHGRQKLGRVAGTALEHLNHALALALAAPED